MEGKRLIEKIRLRNILSFGDNGEEIELLPLNLIVGQNASGKSNLVEIISLLRSLTQDKGLADFISKKGGISEWIWKGLSTKPNSGIKVYLNNKEYQIEFREVSQTLLIVEESINWLEGKYKGKFLRRKSSVKDFFGQPKSIFSNISEENIEHNFNSSDFRFGVGDNIRIAFSSFVAYTDLQTNRSSEMRKPQLPDAPNHFLEEDGSNLALVLNDLEHRGDRKDQIIENLKRVNPLIKDYSIRILGGTVQLFIREEGLEKPISAMRLSDGTLRYLCLLAILCHPEPPPLICIEEPEVGLHPDILPTIAELMKEASQRTQLIVTTHSDILVSAFSDMPEAVLVCEKDENGTYFKRLEAEKLKVWLEEYTLGEAWLRGAFGGTRW